MALKTLFNEVEFLAQYPMVGLAISDSTGPVPGYLFGEINAITYVDNGSNCKSLVNFLISRLKSDTPIVCIKILKLLLYLVKNGHSQIINEVKLHEVPLKEARCFNGPPDEIHGNSFYQTIRNMAKELLEVIFSENREMTERVQSADQSVLTGYGSEASSKKLSGFGYTMKTEKTVSDVVSDSFSSFVEKLFPSPDKETNSQPMSHLSEALPKYKPLVIEKGQNICELPSTEETPSKSVPTPVPRPPRKVKIHRPGRAGGGWESSSDEENSIDSPAPVIEASKESSASIDSLESSKLYVQCNADMSDECKVVEEFTVNEPLTELDYSNVSSLCKRCSSLNCDEVLSFALKKLCENEELVQMRALIFIEYLFVQDVVTLESLVKIVLPYLQKFIEEDKNLQSSVKIKAMKVRLSIEILNKKFQQKVSIVE